MAQLSAVDLEELRPYQKDAIAAIEEGHRRFTRVLFSLPTGTGKTRIAATYATRHFIDRGRRVLWFAHSKELLLQAEDAFLKLGVPRHQIAHRFAGKDELDERPSAPLCLANVAVSTGPDEADLIVIDEAHHSAARSYTEWLSVYRSYATEGPRAFVLGMTATPFRLHEGDPRYPLTSFTFSRPKVRIFEHLCYSRSFMSLASEGYVAPFRHVTWRTEMPFRMKLSSTGDFTGESLESLNTSARNNFIVEHWRREQFRYGKTLVFVGTRKHAKALARAFGDCADYAVSGDLMTEDDRDEVIGRFKSGALPVLVNVGIFKEGVDVTDIRTVILARPTTSTVAFMQMIGRGSRKIPGKDFFNLVDVHDQLGKHEEALASVALLTDAPEVSVPAPGSPRAAPERISRLSDTQLMTHRFARAGTPAVRSIAGWVTFHDEAGKEVPGGVLLGHQDFTILSNVAEGGTLRPDRGRLGFQVGRVVDVSSSLGRGFSARLHALPDAAREEGASQPAHPWAEPFVRWAQEAGASPTEIDCALVSLLDPAPCGVLALGGPTQLIRVPTGIARAVEAACGRQARWGLLPNEIADIAGSPGVHPRLAAREVELREAVRTRSFRGICWELPARATSLDHIASLG